MKTLNMKSVAFLSIEIIWYFAAHPVQAVLCVCICVILHNMDLQGVPKKIVILSGFEFLTLGGVFLGVKNNSKNFLFYKIFWFV